MEAEKTLQTSESKRDYDQNRELLEIAQSADEERAMAATERLIEVNRGLIQSISLRFRDRGVELDDLMQIGTIGIIKAIRSFETSIQGRYTVYRPT